MRGRAFLLVAAFLVLWCIEAPRVNSQWGDALKGLQKTLGGGGEGLSEDEIVRGLKEALQVGTTKAVEVASQVNGYYGNPKIKIPLPGEVQRVEKLLKSVGYGKQIDEFELSMNRAAEHAAPEAKRLFVDSIKKMSISDAQKILKGKDDEATLYFKEKTWNQLQEIFKPIVHKSMSQVGTTQSYQALEEKVHTVPFTDKLNLDLDKYVTGKGLDGLFLMLAEEEKKIRQDPAARVTDLLKKVFGNP
jgi:RNA binding exosome subunit